MVIDNLNNDDNDFFDKINNAIETAMYFPSYKYMENWNIPSELWNEYVNVFGSSSLVQQPTVLQGISKTEAYSEIELFFQQMLNDVLGEVKSFSATGSSKYVDYTLANPSGMTANSISGKMIYIRGFSSFHFELHADSSGSYRWIRYGSPDWESWLSSIKPNSEGKKYLSIPIEKARYVPSDLKPGETHIVRLVEDNGQRTGVFANLPKITPKPFIEDIMKSMWEDKYKEEYERRIQNSLITKAIQQYIKR